MKVCWAENKDRRPAFEQIDGTLKKILKYYHELYKEMFY